MKIKDSKRLSGLLPITFIFLLTILFFYPVIFQGKTFYAFDTLLQYLPWSSYTPPGFKAHNSLITDPVNILYPYHHFIKKHASLKAFVLWNSSNFCGVPTYPVGGYLPEFFLYIFFPLSLAHDLSLWFHLFGAGLFMFLYLKEIRLGTCPALIGAVSWMFNGYIMVWFEFQNVILLAPSFIASLYYTERWLKTRTKLHCFCFTAAVGLSITAAYPLIYFQTIFIVFYFIYRYLLMKRENADFQKISKKDLKIMSLALLIGLCLSSNYFFTGLSFLEEPHRREFSFDELYTQTGKLPVSYLTTLIFPDFFGSPAGKISFTPRTDDTQCYNNYNELCIYSGVTPLFLLLVCLPFFGKKKYALFYFFTAIITLTMAMGSILYYPMAKFVPGLNLSTPTRILYMFGFSVSVLAAIGADILITMENDRKKIIILSWSLLAGAAVIISLFIQTEAGIKWAAGNYISRTGWNQVYEILKEHFSLSSPIISDPLILVFISFLSLISVLIYREKRSKNIFLFLALLILSYDMISFSLFYNTASPRHLEFPETEAIRFLKKDKSAYRIVTYGNFMHNSFAPFGIQDAGGYSSFYPKRYAEFLHLSQNGPDMPFPDNFSRWTYFKSFGSPLLDLINVKYLLTSPSVLINHPKFKLVYDKEIKIYENKDAFPRVFFVPMYDCCESREAAYKMLASYNGSDFRKKVILESLPPEDFRQNNNFKSEAEFAINLVSYRPDRIEIDISTNRKGFLVLNDNYHPAWKAEINNEQTQILRANYIMRAIPIRSGNHRVLLTFYDRFMASGIILTAMGWFVLCIFMIWAFVKEKGDRIRSPQG